MGEECSLGRGKGGDAVEAGAGRGHCGRAECQHVKWVNDGFNVCSPTAFKVCDLIDIISWAHYSVQLSFVSF